MNEQLREAIEIFEQEKGVSGQILVDSLCEAMAAAARKEFGIKSGVHCRMTEDYEFELYREQLIVEVEESQRYQILFSEAQKFQPDIQVGQLIRFPARYKTVVEDESHITDPNSQITDEEALDVVREKNTLIEIGGKVLVPEYDRLVVPELMDPGSLIALEDALLTRPDAKIGEKLITPLQLSNYTRVIAQSVKHSMRGSVRDLERAQILRHFTESNRQIVTARVVNVNSERGDATVEINGNEALLPRSAQIPGERLHVGDRIKIFVADVKSSERGPKVMLSRTDPGMVEKLFEQEVPEVKDGIVVIKRTVRDAGARTKMAVSSTDPKVDPVGACIGPRGSRINAVISQLGGEKIDVIHYSEDPATFIAAALAPAKIMNVEILNAEERKCRVYVPEEQLSLAIGNKGQNARLAANLTRWKIDIERYYGRYQVMTQL